MAAAETIRETIAEAQPILPPGDHTTRHSLHTSLNYEGSFLVHGNVKRVPAERMVPCEEVLPGVTVPLLMMPNIPSRRWDEDHARFEIHDPRLMGIDKRPLRYCYLQYLPRTVHNRKNDAFDAVHIPEDPHHRFQAVLLGAARYVTYSAVDLSGDQPVVCKLTDNQRWEIHKNGWIRMQNRTEWQIGYYLARYVLANGLQAVKETEEVARFLEARGEEARRYASFDVMRQAVMSSVDSFEATYERARRTGAIRRPEPTAARFVTRYFDRHQPDYIAAIADEILQSTAA